MAGNPGITRREAKAVSRTRLLDAALHLLDEVGEAGLTTTGITRTAGMAQSSFYVHFTDMDDLLHNLVEELATERRRRTRVARRGAGTEPEERERLRAAFRLPIQASVSHPRLFHLMIRSRSDRSSALGEWSRALHDESCARLVDDLHAGGLPSDTERDRRVAAMVADGISSLTESLTLGHLDGRYPDVDEIVEFLVGLSSGYVPVRGRPPPDGAG
jgi:AcrR family transcriptional regulator